MGVLGFTEFCRNGHIVKILGHHEVDMEDDVLECPICGAKEFAQIFEWGDPDYGDDMIVPLEPIGYEWHERNDEWFQGKQRVAVYDVSRVTNWSSIRLPGECKNCYVGYDGDSCVDCSVREKRLRFGLKLRVGREEVKGDA